MSQCVYHEAHPGSGVTHSASAYLTHLARPGQGQQPAPPNLVLAKSTVLEVYDIRRLGHSCRLELLGSFKLYGVVEDLAVLRSKSVSSQRDAIMLTFRDAKVSVLDWDDSHHTIRNTSLHYYEGDPSLKGGRTVFPYPPRVVTDPQGRCAAVCMYDHQLALLPAMESDVLEVDEMGAAGDGDANGTDTASATTVGNSFVLNLKKMGIHEVRDLVFLYGYTEPVLLILHQELPTWAGRYRERKDTCALTALSISLHRKRYPIIWSFKHLPSDSFQAMAVPKGGALVLSHNLVLYYTQGSSCGLAVNRFAHAGEVPPRIDFKACTEPLASVVSLHARKYAVNIHPECAPAAGKSAPRAPGLELELSGAHNVWLQPDVCLLGLRTGQLVQLQLCFIANVVSRLQAQVIMLAPYCSCLTKLTSDLLFLASWSGDSMLVRYAKDTGSQEAQHREDEGKALKRRRLDTSFPDEDIDDEEMLFFAHSRALPETSKGRSDDVRYSLHVVDSLTCIAPVHDMIALDPNAHPPPDQVTAPSKVVARLVACVGTGRTGALAVTGISVVPDVLERAPLEDIRGMWALHQVDAAGGGGGELGGQPYHTHLLLSADGSTHVMHSGEELDEITDSEYSAEPTIAAGSLLAGTAACQVVRNSVLLVQGTTKAHQLDLKDAVPGTPEDVHFVDGCICDSYILLSLSSGQALLLTTNATELQLQPVVEAQQELLDRPLASPQDAIVSCSLYLDSSAWLAFATRPPQETLPGLGPHPTHRKSPAAIPNKVYCVVCRASGKLEVYNLPDMSLVFWHADLPAGLKVLRNGGAAPSVVTQPADLEGPGEAGSPTVVGVRLEAFDDMQRLLQGKSSFTCGTAPLLFVLTSEGLVFVYKAFQPAPSSVAFVRQSLPWHGPNTPEAQDGTHRRRMVRFDAMGSPPYSCKGIYLTGDQPAWMVVNRSAVYAHAMPTDSAVTAMTPFHNVNCPFGFVVGTQKGFMEICGLPPELQLANPWPVRKIPLKACPNRIAQHPTSGALLVLVSKLLPYEPRDPAEIGGDQHAAAAYVAADVVAKTAGREEVAELRVMDQHTLQVLGSALMNRSELGLAVKALSLRNTKTEAQQLLIAVGTALCLGEDYPCTGRIVFYDLVQVESEAPAKEENGQEGEEPEPSVPKTFKLEELYSKEFPGPLTVVGEFHGYLMVATGHRLELHSWNGTNLVKAAFFDGPMLISSINTVKDYVLLGDIHNSVIFLRFKEAGRQLQQLSKDFDRYDVATTEFLFNAGKLSFVVADSCGTLRVIVFDQDDPQSWKGKKLLLRGAFHTGHITPRLIRLRMVSQDNANRQATFFGSVAGSFSFLIPSWDPAMFQRLEGLQKLLVHGLPHAAGLNPKAFRNRHTKIPKGLGGGESFIGPQDTGCILDGALVLEYMHLDRVQQLHLAAKLSTTRSQLLKDFQSLTAVLAIL